jgi:hypothetical protein
MATVSAQQQSSLTSSRSSSIVNGNSSHGQSHTGHLNGHPSTQSDVHNSNVSHSNGTTSSGSKKAGNKAKKATTDPSEVPKLLAAKISQLESDQAGEKEEEAELGE